MPKQEFQWVFQGLCIHCGARCYYNDDEQAATWSSGLSDCEHELKKCSLESWMQEVVNNG